MTYCVFIDGMDGDLFENSHSACNAAQYAIDNGARRVVIEKWNKTPERIIKEHECMFCCKADDGHWFCSYCGNPELDEDGDVVYRKRSEE